MDEKTRRDFEEWSRDKNVAAMKPEDFSGLLSDMWSTYKRQKQLEEDAGREVANDISRMREIFLLAAQGELTVADVEERFPDEVEGWRPGQCPLCAGEGWYFSHTAKFRFAHRDRVAPGYVTCNCLAGKSKRECLKEMGRSKKRGFRG
jgi:hypothetical protein